MSVAPGQFLGTIRRRATSPEWVVTELRHGRPNQFAPHEHRWACLTLLLGGQYAEKASDGGQCRWTERVVNSLVVRPARAPHADRIGNAGAWFLTVELSPELVGRRQEAVPLAEWALARDPRLVPLAWRLHRALKSEAEPAVLDGYVEALVAGLGPEERGKGRPPWLARVLERLHDAPAERVRLDELARDCGVHPAHLTRAFRRHLGQTVGTYLRALRLAAAMRRLSDPAVTPAQAALEAGFYDQSHLTRTLRGVTGLTPGRYRKEAA